MQGGGVELDGERIQNPNAHFTPDQLAGRLLRVGKHRFARLLPPA
jgi:hypothetical protein